MEIGCDVSLVAVEALALALPPMAHLAVLDGDTTIRCNAFANAGASIGRIGLEILLPAMSQGGGDAQTEGVG
jgi:hypothetical protein